MGCVQLFEREKRRPIKDKIIRESVWERKIRIFFFFLFFDTVYILFLIFSSKTSFWRVYLRICQIFDSIAYDTNFQQVNTSQISWFFKFIYIYDCRNDKFWWCTIKIMSVWSSKNADSYVIKLIVSSTFLIFLFIMGWVKRDELRKKKYQSNSNSWLVFLENFNWII